MKIHAIGSGTEILRSMLSAAITAGGNLINIDEADVAAFLDGSENIYVFSASSSRQNTAEEATAEIIRDGGEILKNANRVIINIEICSDGSFEEVCNIAHMIEMFVQPDANIIFSAQLRDELSDTVNINVFTAA